VHELKKNTRENELFRFLTELDCQTFFKDLMEEEETAKASRQKMLRDRKSQVEHLFEQYGFRKNELEVEQKVFDAMIEVLKVAYINKCYVFDLLSTEPDKEDFNGALLQCLLSAIGQNTGEKELTNKKGKELTGKEPEAQVVKPKSKWALAEKAKAQVTSLADFSGKAQVTSLAEKAIAEKAKAQVMWKKLKYAMLWNRDDVLNKVLEDANKNLAFRYDTDIGGGLRVLDRAVLFALQRKNVKALQTLFNHNADVEMLNVGSKFCLVQWARDHAVDGSSDLSTHPDSKYKIQYMHVAEQWQKLIKYETLNSPNFRDIAKEISKQYKDKISRDQKPEDDELLKQEKSGKAKVEKLLKKYEAACQDVEQGCQSRRPIPPQLRISIFQHAHNAKKRSKRQISENARKEKGEKESLGRVKQMALLESIYIDLLGSEFRYRIGIQGPYMDLFFWTVLNNRFDLARVMWKKIDRPVMAGLAAAFLLRQLGKKFERKDRAASSTMFRNADEFENLSVKVFHAAVEEKSELALKTLDSHLQIWNGLTLLDLAVKGGSHKFVEECCSEAIDNRLFGDMSRYDMNTKMGVLALIAGIVSFGLLPAFVSKFISWDPPPICEKVRRLTQRRKRPPGYPFKPSVHDLLKIEGKPGHFIDSKDRPRVDKMSEGYSPKELEELWSKTFTILQRLKLFWSAPIVIFLFNALWSIAATLVFYIWFYTERIGPSRFIAQTDADGATSHSWSLGVENTMVCYFYLNILREGLQCTGEMFDAKSWRIGLWIYLFDFWNMFDILSIVTFAIGHALRDQYKGREIYGILLENATEVGFPPHFFSVSGTETSYEAWALFYSLSIFCLCFRVLRVLYVSSSMGLIISIFKAMMSDVWQFMVIYFIVVLGFSVIFLGISDPTSLLNDCSHDPAPDDVLTVATREQQLYMKCIAVNFFFRTLFQSFGEFFLNDMGNLTSLIFFILLFIITNVLLMNLLVALMTSTYEEVAARASRQRLIDRYALIEEHRRAYTYPVPFNVFIIIWHIIDFIYSGRKHVQKLHPDCGDWKLWDIFISSCGLFEEIEDSTDITLQKDIALTMRQAHETVEDQHEQIAALETAPPTKMHGDIKYLLQMQRKQGTEQHTRAQMTGGGWIRGGRCEGASQSAVAVIRDYIATRGV
jgi:hypothetical protein